MVFGKIDRLVSRAYAIADDLLDHFETPPADRFRADGRFPAVEHAVLPPEIQQRIWRSAEQLPQGVLSTTIVTAGSEHSKHGHVFAFLPQKNSIEGYFLDPEYEVGKQHPLRPKVVNLVALHLYHNFPAEAAILRYRAEHIQRIVEEKYPEYRGGVDNMQLQLRFARELIEREGLPQELEEAQDVVFRLILRSDHVTLQQAGGTQEEFQALCSGAPLSRGLQNKLTSHQHVLARMTRLLEDGAFRSKPTVTI